MQLHQPVRCSPLFTNSNREPNFLENQQPMVFLVGEHVLFAHTRSLIPVVLRRRRVPTIHLLATALLSPLAQHSGEQYLLLFVSTSLHRRLINYRKSPLLVRPKPTKHQPTHHSSNEIQTTVLCCCWFRCHPDAAMYQQSKFDDKNRNYLV